ncbi:MAG: hypothetical protein ACM30E_03375 [Nitrososphaerales archaeon]
MHRRVALGVAALAAATLLLETTLTRLLAVAQFYHFAFLVVSLALLGFGASGALLSLVPRLGTVEPSRLLAGAGAAFVAATVLAYAAVNLLPLDSYSIAWDRRQILYFVLYYLALTLPFICSGLGIGAALAATRGSSHLTYAANLLGSAAGVLLAPAALALAGVPAAVLAACLVALLPALFLARAVRWQRVWSSSAAVVLLAVLVVLAGLNLGGRGVMGLTLSPYKGLVYAHRYPGSSTVFSRWNALARVDVVANAGTRQLPGLSYTFPGGPPDQLGLSVDADSVQPVPLTSPAAFVAGPYMPEAVAFQLRPGAQALVLEPAGGLGVLQAVNGGASSVTAVLGNPLTGEAVAAAAGSRSIYANPRVRVVNVPLRSFLKQKCGPYDVVFLPLTDVYRPVASGAYSLAETYTLTSEALGDALRQVGPDGILVITRWVQTPPSEDLRLLATLREVLLDAGLPNVERALVAYRGIQTVTALVKPNGWTATELAPIRSFAESRRYDLVAAPGVQASEANRFNRMPSPDLYLQFQKLSAADPGSFYAAYPFAVAPATDDRPFFFHFFRWGQTREVLATLGRTWQPFGGSGYLVLFALLALVTVLSAALILVPALVQRERGGVLAGWGRRSRALLYFGLLGVGFLFVEIPLIQRWMLVAGHATYAFTGVVLILLLGSSVGSMLAPRVNAARRPVLMLLSGLIALLAVLSGRVAEAALGLPGFAQWILLGAMLLPPAVLMGMPFPLGLAWIEAESPRLTPHAWAVNGCASVIASVVAAILTLSAGFTVVVALGAACYALAAFALPQVRPALSVSPSAAQS